MAERQVELGSCTASWASVEFRFHSRWDGTPLGVCCGLCVGTRLDAGVKFRREMVEAWTGVMAAEGKEGWI